MEERGRVAPYLLSGELWREACGTVTNGSDECAAAIRAISGADHHRFL